MCGHLLLYSRAVLRHKGNSCFSDLKFKDIGDQQISIRPNLKMGLFCMKHTRKMRNHLMTF